MESWLREKIIYFSLEETPGDFGLDDNLTDVAGLDSLGKLELLSEIEDRYDIELFTDVKLDDIPVTMRGIIAEINRLTAGSEPACTA